MKNEYTLTLPPQAIQIIVDGLGELKLRVAAPVMDLVQSQIMKQDAPPKDEVAE